MMMIKSILPMALSLMALSGSVRENGSSSMGSPESGKGSTPAFEMSPAFHLHSMQDYRVYSPCTFIVKLPVGFSIRSMYSDRSPNYCDYAVRTSGGRQVIEIHSMLKSRFETESITKLYYKALGNEEYDITYKTQKGNWFVVSGYRVATGRIFYWKRVVGRSYISDLFIEYPEKYAYEIEPHIAVVSQSFDSD